MKVRELFLDPKIAGTVPSFLRFSPDGSSLAYLKTARAGASAQSLWVVVLPKGTPTVLLDAEDVGGELQHELSEEEVSRRERARCFEAGIVSFEWSPDGRSILVPVGGEVFLVPVQGEASAGIRKLAGGGLTDARFSPSGEHVAFVRDRNLWIVGVEGGEERAVTRERGEAVGCGVAEFVAQEEMHRDTGYWWSPDSTRIAFCRVDESSVSVFLRPEIGERGIRVEHQRYPFAGGRNAKVTLHVFERSSGEIREIPLGDEVEYLARVDWLPDSRRLAIQTQPRDQKRLDLKIADSSTGAQSTALTEQSDTWINLHGALRFLEGGELVWLSEREGFPHLELRRLEEDGRAALVRTLTAGDWCVTRLAGVEAGFAYFEGNRDSCLETQLYRVPLRGDASIQRLTRPKGCHLTQVAKDGRFFASVWSDESLPPRAAVFDPSGERALWIEENEIRAGHGLAALKISAGEFVEVKSPIDGATLQGRLFASRIPGRRPVLVHVYGGPHAQIVTRSWHRFQPWFSLLNERGIHVLQLDNHGSANRGKAFEEAIHHRMGTVEIDDQLAGVEWLRRRGDVDPSRLAIFGWSYGGYLVLRALLTRPGVFRAGISVAPVSDWSLYDTHYTERYLGLPSETDYADVGCSKHAGRLSDRLLMIHGMADDNVLFSQSTQLHRRFQELGLPFEMMNYPGERHAVAHRACLGHLFETATAFLERELR